VTAGLHPTRACSRRVADQILAAFLVAAFSAGDVEDASVRAGGDGCFNFSPFVQAAVAKRRCDSLWASKGTIQLGGKSIQFKVFRVMSNGASLDNDRSSVRVNETRGISYPKIWGSIDLELSIKAAEYTATTGLEMFDVPLSVSPEDQESDIRVSPFGVDGCLTSHERAIRPDLPSCTTTAPFAEPCTPTASPWLLTANRHASPFVGRRTGFEKLLAIAVAGGSPVTPPSRMIRARKIARGRICKPKHTHRRQKLRIVSGSMRVSASVEHRELRGCPSKISLIRRRHIADLRTTIKGP
jgi:hypothetical protein